MCTTRHFEVVLQLASLCTCIRAPELLQGREDSLEHGLRENEGGLSCNRNSFIRVETWWF